MSEKVANNIIVELEIIRSDGTREILGTVTSSEAENDNDSTYTECKE